jgi:hypothetical protein
MVSLSKGHGLFGLVVFGKYWKLKFSTTDVVPMNAIKRPFSLT